MRATRFLDIGVHVLQPAVTGGRTLRGAGVFIKTAAEVFPPAIRLPAEDNVRSSLHDRVQFLVPLRQVAIGLFQIERLLL